MSQKDMGIVSVAINAIGGIIKKYGVKLIPQLRTAALITDAIRSVDDLLQWLPSQPSSVLVDIYQMLVNSEEIDFQPDDGLEYGNWLQANLQDERVAGLVARQQKLLDTLKDRRTSVASENPALEVTLLASQLDETCEILRCDRSEVLKLVVWFRSWDIDDLRDLVDAEDLTMQSRRKRYYGRTYKNRISRFVG